MLWLILPVLQRTMQSLSSHLAIPQLGWAFAAVLGVAGYITFLTAVANRTRRMVLLIIDDLDRCDGTRVVRLLEAVHTVLRERAAPRRLTRWRAPAPFAVLVVANGAWIRDAFSKHYETFDRDNNTDTVHDLGADFLQKIFDHSVLVPGLSPQQTEELVHVVAHSRFHRSSPTPTAAHARQHGQEPRQPGQRAEPDDAQKPPASITTPPAAEGRPNRQPVAGPDADPSNTPTPTAQGMPTPGTEPSKGSTMPTQAARGPLSGPPPAPVGASAARDDLGANAPQLINHLLTNYPTILPPNPRLIIRVATSWAMLRAVGRSIGHQVDAEPANELLVRAAVVWVRFPVLVDELLDADQPPVIDPAEPRCDSKWRRRDVQTVLRLNDGNLLKIEDLAHYYGKFFHDPVPAAPPVPNEPLTVQLINPPPAPPKGK